TGAGGSIGSEMARQVCRFGPSQLVLVEQAETPLFDIHNELRAAWPEAQLDPVICDIYDRRRVGSLWKDRAPDVVIHAAAHKHVPLMERNPCEAIKNNTLGTRNVADASCEARVDDFVMISTDKAVRPTSVMGASKRVAEMVISALSCDSEETSFLSVRFGNVLGSRGSVVPLFRKQIAAGGPVTVMHKDIERYFMTIPEAANLVIQAGAIDENGQLFILDMGEPIKIADLARRMITLSGYEPDVDIEIEYVGLRPGEKLYEELLTTGEDITPTSHPKILSTRVQTPDLEEVKSWLVGFQELLMEGNDQRAIERLINIVPEYRPESQLMISGDKQTETTQ
ncbi:MAG: UDP-N-acetylglucosamine 4,6-dehydratase family protein, partial [Candidatus Sumerlaeota bacterium]